LSDDPFNQTYLSPGHFLIGEPLTQLPTIDYTNVKCNKVANLSTTTSTVLAEMVIRLPPEPAAEPTMPEDIPNLQPGDLVFLKEDNTTPLHWPTAVIAETHPGKDNIVRVVTLRTPKGTFKRPVTKIYPFPRK
jgi:hypothetical protein